MNKTKNLSAVIDILDVNGAFVSNALRPFTSEEFHKIKTILAHKQKRKSKKSITDRDLRAAGLEHLIAETENGS